MDRTSWNVTYILVVTRWWILDQLNMLALEEDLVAVTLGSANRNGLSKP